MDQLLARAGLEDRRNEVAERFGGWRFDRTDGIHNPSSVMRYLASLKEGAPTKQDACQAKASELVKDAIHMLAESEAEQAKLFALLGGNPVVARINPYMTWRDMYEEAGQLWTLLYVSGCLTVAGDSAVYPGKACTDETILVVPNKEVFAVFQGELAVWLAKMLPPREQQALCDALWSRNVQALERILDELFVGSGVQAQADPHGHVVVFLGCHGLLSGILAMRCGEVVSSGEGDEEFRDILVVDWENSCAAVLELTLVASVTELEEHAEKALKQIEERALDDHALDDHALDARVRAEGSCTTVLHVGIAFCDQKTRVLFKEAGV